VGLVLGPIVFAAGTFILSAVIAAVGEPASSTPDPPQGSWGFDYTATNASSGSLTVTHQGGDAVDVSRLTVATGNSSVEWGTGTTETGDSKTVAVGPDETVRLGWHAGNTTETLAEWDGV